MVGGSIKSEPGFAPAFNGKFVGTGNDYISVDADGKRLRLNAHGVIQTEDGASVYLHYTGIVSVSPELTAILSGESESITTPFGDSFTHLTFEVSALIPCFAHLLTSGITRLAMNVTPSLRLKSSSLPATLFTKKVSARSSNTKLARSAKVEDFDTDICANLEFPHQASIIPRTPVPVAIPIPSSSSPRFSLNLLVTAEVTTHKIAASIKVTNTAIAVAKTVNVLTAHPKGRDRSSHRSFGPRAHIESFPSGERMGIEALLGTQVEDYGKCDVLGNITS
ncbi:hypothetical protein LOZ05_002556 [Ophidiomyces ophidiicola]|uniref:uncharacterized protein n=1 Tax=Ophidiomyces ophidiicola TaxID=1387563 RepID=UPI0020C1DDCE|nr:uncharacterized protein LOZ57_000173 [Ophidiomyces ophidiicola]KAI1953832.1 hypothetical protein LOZ57_000173 [Ophidiomyces ophidiicola]KAI2053938.1 hypothetical protein LOZ43_004131 [Ophidiomyces ophidiicola]KAI2126819.1 hypothetical protein LOZ31_003112 [Ophidiomyces ophidiicola]KAI2154363.1 hypothetical protein LOZ25_004937 [Ophidiomyces ophidiicola]KAI2271799.1 hypothetical protein LOZ05_002556 [Ophidiomyces ophidiicola]